MIARRSFNDQIVWVGRLDLANMGPVSLPPRLQKISSGSVVSAATFERAASREAGHIRCPHASQTPPHPGIVMMHFTGGVLILPQNRIALTIPHILAIPRIGQEIVIPTFPTDWIAMCWVGREHHRGRWPSENSTRRKKFPRRLASNTCRQSAGSSIQPLP